MNDHRLPDDIVSLIDLVECVGWKDHYAPHVRRRLDNFLKALRDPSVLRAQKSPDDYLRGYVDALEWALTWMRDSIDQATENVLIESQDQEKQKSYDIIASLGPTWTGSIPSD